MLAAKSRFFTSVITGPQTFQYARQDIARKIMLVEWKIYDYKFLAQKPVNSAFQLIVLLHRFQNYWIFVCKCKRDKHKTAFRGRNVTEVSRNAGRQTGSNFSLPASMPKVYKMPRRQHWSKRTLSNLV